MMRAPTSGISRTSREGRGRRGAGELLRTRSSSAVVRSEPYAQWRRRGGSVVEYSPRGAKVTRDPDPYFLRRVIFFLAADVTTRVVVARASGAEPTNHEHHHSREEGEERGRWDTKKAIDEEGRKIHSKKKVIGFSWCEKSDFGGEISRKVAVRRNFNLDLFE